MVGEFFCKYFGWHRPKKHTYMDGINNKSICKYCQMEIIQDSQGGWF